MCSLFSGIRIRTGEKTEAVGVGVSGVAVRGATTGQSGLRGSYITSPLTAEGC